MAQILPSFSDDISASGASPAEWMTLKRLQEGLAGDWLVFHNIRWTQAWDHGTNVGEIDFCVLSPTGKVVVIEQKNGELIERPDGIFKHYPNGPKNVGTQIQRTLDILFDTIYRYKGQQNQVILFVEIDFETLDEQSRNKLYCGMTRATSHLECFFSNRAAEILSKRLHSGSLS